jgi:hypothetical protein
MLGQISDIPIRLDRGATCEFFKIDIVTDSHEIRELL